MEWHVSSTPVDYPEALAAMEMRVAAIARNEQPELVWLLEHPPLYTAGTSAKAADLLTKERFPVFDAGRGGEYTYHGPGQRIAYVMLDLKRRAAPSQPDLRRYIHQLEEWIIATLRHFHITGERRPGRVGVWVVLPDGREEKIAAIGVRVRKWVTFHGISLNVDPDLSHYTGIVPCGISEHGVTSLAKLGVRVEMEEVNEVLKRELGAVFGF